MNRIYLDHNATAPLRPAARRAFDEALDLGPGNASSVHESGRTARGLIDEARERIAGALGIHEEELTFTSGGTEALNLAIMGTLRATPTHKSLVSCKTEHAAVLGACISSKNKRL